MIAGFRHKGLRRFFEDNDRSKIPPQMAERIRTNCCIVFRFADGKASDVDLLDYH